MVAREAARYNWEIRTEPSYVVNGSRLIPDSVFSRPEKVVAVDVTVRYENLWVAKVNRGYWSIADLGRLIWQSSAIVFTEIYSDVSRRRLRWLAIFGMSLTNW